MASGEPLSGWRELYLAEAFRQSGGPGEAIQLLEQLLSEEPGNPASGSASLALGELLLDQGRASEAVGVLLKALAGPLPEQRVSPARILLGRCQAAAGMPLEAAESWLEVLRANSRDLLAPQALELILELADVVGKLTYVFGHL